MDTRNYSPDIASEAQDTLLNVPNIPNVNTVLNRRDMLRVGIAATGMTATTFQQPAKAQKREEAENPNTHVLEFSAKQKSHVLLPPLPLLPGGRMPTFTIQTRVTPSTMKKGEMSILSSHQNKEGVCLRINDEYFELGVGVGNKLLTVRSDKPAEVDTTVDIAAVCFNGELMLFIDGKQQRMIRQINEPPKQWAYPFTIGADPKIDTENPRNNFPPECEHYFDGTIAGLRISLVPRNKMAPKKVQQQGYHEIDRNDLALYLFDGSEKILQNRAKTGNIFNGEMYKTQWVKP